MQYTYNSLFNSCQNYCVDNSTTIDMQSYAAEFPNLVQLSEMRILKDIPNANFEAIATGNMISGNQLIVKPADLIAIQDMFMTVGTSLVYITQRSKSYLDSYWPNFGITDQPLYYADYSTSQWQVAPVPDQSYSYQVNYIQRPLPMSVTNQTTWIGDKLGEVLLYATLIESALYFREDFITENGVIKTWENAYETYVTQALNELYPFISGKNTILPPLTRNQGTQS